MSVEFYEKYCKTNKITVDPNIKAALAKSSTSREVSLAEITIASVKNCEALGATICANEDINKLDLTNSMLPISGLCSLFDSLINSNLNAINLKGNNIYGNSTVRLGHLLSKNTSIKVLLLEWNNLGAPLKTFSKFCLSLISNRTLEVLDLRNNNLNTDCATELRDVILQNTSIKEIDLRWNNIGVEGGKQLLNTLNSNHTLNVLKLQGNGIPADMISAIDNTVRHNSAVQKINNEYEARQDILTKQLNCIHRKRVSDFKTICEQSAQQLQPCLDKIKEYSMEKRKLIEEVEQSKVKVLQLEEQVTYLHTQLDYATKQIENKEQTISEHEGKVSAIREQSQNDIDSLKAKFDEEEKKLKRELDGFQFVIETEKAARTNLETKLHDSQSSIETLLNEMKDLKERLSVITTMHNRVLEEEKYLHQDSLDHLLKELKNQKQKSSDLLAEVQKDNNEKIESLIKKIKELESSLQAENNNVLAERSKWNEEKSNMIAEASEKQAKLLRTANGQLKEVTEEKIKLEQELMKSQASIKSIVDENEAMKSEISSYMSKVSLLQNQLTESKTTMNYLKNEHSQTSQLIDSFKSEAENYKKELMASRQLLSDLQLENANLSDKYRKDICELNFKLQNRTEEIVKLRADEIERAHGLYSAINKYFGHKC